MKGNCEFHHGPIFDTTHVREKKLDPPEADQQNLP